VRGLASGEDADFSAFIEEDASRAASRTHHVATMIASAK
jgi:hypothetical protein